MNFGPAPDECRVCCRVLENPPDCPEHGDEAQQLVAIRELWAAQQCGSWECDE